MTISNFQSTLADHDLVESARDGNDAAFSALVERYQEMATKIMWRFARDADTHSELVHEVFVQMYFSLANYRGNAPFAHYFSALASRVGYTFWRTQQAKPKECSLSEDFVDSRASSSNHTSADQPTLFSLLSELNADDRAVLTLTYYDEKNAKEAAEILGWSHTVTRMRLTRARRRLRKIAKKHGISEED